MEANNKINKFGKMKITIEENKKSLPTQQNLFREKYSVSTEAHFEIAETFLDACETIA